MTAFLAALGFLTALPLPSSVAPGPRDLGRSVAWFPVVGAMLGAVLAAVDGLARATVGDPAAAALVLAAAAVLTGALHLDGFADTCDGFFARVPTAERRLEIMRDSRVGGFGAAGVALLLLVQYSALLSVPADERGAALVVAGLLSRWTMVQAIGQFPYARAHGLGRAFKDNAGVAVYAAAAAVTVAGALAIGGPKGGAAALVTVVLCALAGRYALTKLPGLTGDLYGAICELTLAVILLTFAAL